MSMNDPLANALSKVLNCENLGKTDCEIKPISKEIKIILKLLQDKKYVGQFNEVESSSGNSMKLHLLGRINKCGVIKPRHAVGNNDFEKFEKRFLPAIGFGFLIVSTSQGIMTNEDAKEKGVGGRLLAYCY